MQRHLKRKKVVEPNFFVRKCVTCAENQIIKSKKVASFPVLPESNIITPVHNKKSHYCTRYFPHEKGTFFLFVNAKNTCWVNTFFLSGMRVCTVFSFLAMQVFSPSSSSNEWSAHTLEFPPRICYSRSVFLLNNNTPYAGNCGFGSVGNYANLFP